MNNKGFYLTAVILLILGISLFFLPDFHNTKEPEPSQLFTDVLDASRYFDVDRLASVIVDEDPGLLLVDVRDTAAFASFSLPMSINIPLADILKPENQQRLRSPGKYVVFYSNGDIHSEQAYITCRRAGLHSQSILRGGLNAWFETIVNTKKPSETESSEAFDVYSFRLGVRQHLYGGVGETVPQKVAAEKPKTTEPVKVQPVQHTRVVEGGC
ncbi:MAG: rhodanese-like domain-containing protein [Bacteroidales bacterium]|nr:rhodanese-like domain-containing protein [Bacteroidales bacterium]